MENTKQFNLKELLADKTVTIYNSSLTKEDFCVEDALLFSESKVIIRSKKVHIYNGHINENIYFTSLYNENDNDIVIIVCKTEEELMMIISITKRICSMNLFTFTILSSILKVTVISFDIVRWSYNGLVNSCDWITKRIKKE